MNESERGEQGNDGFKGAEELRSALEEDAWTPDDQAAWELSLREQGEAVTEDYLRELHRLEPVAEKLIELLADGIKSSRWDAVVGDDVRGRVVALIVGSVMKREAEEHDEEAPARLFLATGQHDMGDRWNAIEAYVDSSKEKLGERVLFTTEYVESGETVMRAIELFQQRGITCDIATAYISDRYGEEDDLPIDAATDLIAEIKAAVPGWKGTVYAAKQRDGAPNIDSPRYKEEGVMSVEKTEGPTTISSARARLEQAVEDGYDEEEMEGLKQYNQIKQVTVVKPVREEIRRVSDCIYDRVLG